MDKLDSMHIENISENYGDAYSRLDITSDVMRSEIVDHGIYDDYSVVILLEK